MRDDGATPGDHKRNFALRPPAGVVNTKFRRSSATIFLELLRQLPRDTNIGLGSDFGKNVERFQKAMRGLEVYTGLGPRYGSLQFRAAATALYGNEPAKVKGVGGKSRTDECCENGAWPGQNTDVKPALSTSPNQAESGIRYSRHAGICYQHNGLSGGNFFYQLGRAGFFIVLVQADHRFLDIVMKQENGRMTRILCRNQIRFAKRQEGSQGDVLQIPDGCRNDGQQGSTTIPRRPLRSIRRRRSARQ